MHFKPDIDTREQLPDIATLSVDDIAVLSRTVRSTATGSGDNKVVTYRHGITTKIGNIERELWKGVASEIVDRECGEGMLAHMVEYLSTGKARSRAADDIFEEALERCAERDFDSPKWTYYVDFNEKYRPEALNDDDLVTILPFCCNKPIRATKEQLGDSYWFFCPRCNRRTAYTQPRWTGTT